MYFQRESKETLLKQKALAVWITGLPSSGKTTLAIAVSEILSEIGFFCQVLDGDMLRRGLNNNLGFSMDDRFENIRRASEVCKILLNNGIITLCSFISPTIIIRETARQIIGRKDFVEIWLNTPLNVCEASDTHGLYKKARAGLIPDLTGISSEYENPVSPDLVIDTSLHSADHDAEAIVNYILPRLRQQTYAKIR